MEELLTLVEIQLGRDHYLIDSDIIDKFIHPLAAKAVYDAPPYIEGMVLWDQNMIPSINVAPLLGMKRDDTAVRKRTMIIAAGKVSESAIAVSVDEVHLIRKIKPRDIMPVDISACQGIEDYVKGIVRISEEGQAGDKQLVLLYMNLEKMLRELLRGRVAEPVPDFFVWKWEKKSEIREDS